MGKVLALSSDPGKRKRAIRMLALSPDPWKRKRAIRRLGPIL